MSRNKAFKAALAGLFAGVCGGAASPAIAQDCGGCVNSPIVWECTTACWDDWYHTHPWTPAPVRYTFGALAVGMTDPTIFMFGYGGRTQAEAESLALNACRKESPAGQDCRIAVWFRNSCGAIAFGDNGGWGSGWAYTARQAGKEAVKTCEALGASHCEVKSTQCSEL